MATTFTRVSDSGSAAGKATEITLNELGFFSLAAVKTDGGKLKLIAWRTGDTVSRLADSGDQGAVGEIAMTRNLNRTVTAVSTGSGTLKLISWNDGSGSTKPIPLLDSGDQGKASLIAIQPAPSGSAAELVTAHRAEDGKLKLIAWNLQGGNGAFTRLGDSGDRADPEGQVDRIALTVNGNVCVTAVGTSGGHLKLISWAISPDGGRIERRGDSGDQAGTVSEVAMAGSVTAVRKAGKLRLINWRISPDGATIDRIGDSANQAGEATNIAISRFSPSRYVTAVRTDGGNLMLIAFDVDPSGAVTRTSPSKDSAGTISEVALVTPSNNKLVTAVRDGDGNLKIINYTMQN